MSKRPDENWKELARKNLVSYLEFNKGKHLRFEGGITVDYWPATKRAFIMGTDKAFQVSTTQQLFQICNMVLWPEGVQFTPKAKRSKETQKFVNLDLMCPICQKNIRQGATYTDQLVVSSCAGSSARYAPTSV